MVMKEGGVNAIPRLVVCCVWGPLRQTFPSSEVLIIPYGARPLGQILLQTMLLWTTIRAHHCYIAV